MSQKISKAIIYLSIIAVVIGAIFLANGLILAWSPPTQAPTGGNVPAPLNVGGSDQWKDGRLGVGTSVQGIYWLTDVGNSLYFQNRTDQTKMVIGENGNVGIGETTPGAKLDVAGNINLDVELRIDETSPQIRFEDTGESTYWIHANSNRLYFLWDGNLGGSWVAPYPLYFDGRNSIFDGGTMYVDAVNDRVGIGDTTPDAKLDVEGNIRASNYCDQSGNCKTIGGMEGCSWSGWKCHCKAQTSGSIESRVIFGIQCTDNVVTDLKIFSLHTTTGDSSCPTSFSGCDIYAY